MFTMYRQCEDDEDESLNLDEELGSELEEEDFIYSDEED